MSQYQCSAETQAKIRAFVQADKEFKAEWEQFELRAQQHLEYLDKLREERNAKLDDAKRSLRAETQDLDITVHKSVKAGPFTVQKKWSSFYQPEKLVAGLKTKSLYDSALSSRIVREKIEIASFEEVQNFLKVEGVLADFEDCEDGIEQTPAIYGPKPILAFGVEAKEAK